MSRKWSDGIFINRQLYKSEAWVSLRGAAPKIYLLFLDKRQIEMVGRKGKYRVVNDGKIEFTYKEAKRRGFSKDVFGRGIKELCAKGFLRIAEPGGFNKECPTLYGFSDMWKRYGKPEFDPVTKPKRKYRVHGFKPGNQLWRRRSKKNLRDKNAHDVMRKNTRDKGFGIVYVMRTNAHGKKENFLYKRSKNKWLSTKIA